MAGLSPALRVLTAHPCGTARPPAARPRRTSPPARVPSDLQHVPPALPSRPARPLRHVSGPRHVPSSTSLPTRSLRHAPPWIITSVCPPPPAGSHGHCHVPRTATVVPRTATVTSLAQTPSRSRSHVPRRLTAGNHDSEDAVGRVGSRLPDIQIAMPSDSDSGAAGHRPVRDPSAAGPGSASASIRRPSRWALGGVLRREL